MMLLLRKKHLLRRGVLLRDIVLVVAKRGVLSLSPPKNRMVGNAKLYYMRMLRMLMSTVMHPS